MIRKTLIIGAAVAALATSGQALAQNSASTSTQGSATIAAPITLTENTTLRFGSVTRPTSGTSTVTVDANNSCGRTVSGNGAAVASTTGCATYSVGGQSGQAFNITNDATFNMTRSGGSETITVTLNKNKTSGTIGSDDTFSVGGSFDMTTTTVAGAYSGSFNVTVTYQ